MVKSKKSIAQSLPMLNEPPIQIHHHHLQEEEKEKKSKSNSEKKKKENDKLEGKEQKN